MAQSFQRSLCALASLQFAFASAAIFAVCRTAAVAQVASYLSGTVTQNGVPVAGADVEIAGNNLRLHRTTDARGAFSVIGLSVGQFTVTVKKGDLGASRLVEIGSSGVSLAFDLQPLKEIAKLSVTVRPPVTKGSGTDIYIGPQSLTKYPVLTNMSDILRQLPSASIGSNGQVHLNGDHNGINYVVDGIPLPQSLNRALGNEIDPTIIGSISVLEGAFPAQYGDRFAGVMDIGTKAFTGPAGAYFQGQGGSYNTYDGTLTAHAPVAAGGSFVLSARLAQNGLGLDPATPNAPNDGSSTATQFVRLSVPFRRGDSLNLDVLNSYQTFQIPPDLNFGVPAQTDDNEQQYDTFASLIYRHSIGSNASLSFGPSYKYARLVDRNDLQNDLAAGAVNPCGPPPSDFSNCPVFSVFADRSYSDLRFNLAYAVQSGKHDVRSGFQFGFERLPIYYDITLQSGNTLSPLNPGGTFTAIDDTTNSGSIQQFYLQDGWQWSSDWRLDYGVRYDRFTLGSTDFQSEFNQISPRIKLTRFFGPHASVYGYYGRLFVPFSFENVDPRTAALLYAPEHFPGADYDLKPQEDSLYEFGFHVPLGVVDFGTRISHKVSANWIDDTQVGATNLHQDINFPVGSVNSYDFLFQAPLRNGSNAYLSLSHVIALNSMNCETQLLQNCALAGPPGGALVQADHDQQWDSTGGVLLNDRHRGWFSLDYEYGSGLSQDPSLCYPLPDAEQNCKVPPHLIFNVAKGFGLGPGQLVFSITNLLNDRYAITLDNSLQGTHYARPRSFYLRYDFGKQ